jgi:hypothetical protein
MRFRHPQVQSRIIKARLQVSFDNGKTWARVRRVGTARFQARFTAPPGQTVSLRLTARDAAGATIAETILSAYQTSA